MDLTDPAALELFVRDVAARYPTPTHLVHCLLYTSARGEIELVGFVDELCDALGVRRVEGAQLAAHLKADVYKRQR